MEGEKSLCEVTKKIKVVGVIEKGDRGVATERRDNGSRYLMA